MDETLISTIGALSQRRSGAVLARSKESSHSIVRRLEAGSRSVQSPTPCKEMSPQNVEKLLGQ